MGMSRLPASWQARLEASSVKWRGRRRRSSTLVLLGALVLLHVVLAGLVLRRVVLPVS